MTSWRFGSAAPPWRRVRVALAVIAVLWGSASLLASSSHAPAAVRRLVEHDRPPPAAAPPQLFAGQLLVYGRHGLTPAQVAAVSRAVHGEATPVYGAEIAFRSGRKGYPQVAVQAFTVDARGYAGAVGRPQLLAALTKGLVLSRTGAALRHARQGDALTLADGRRVRVSAVVDDAVLGGFEAAGSPRVLPRPRGAAASYLLVAAGESVPRTAAAVQAAVPDRQLRVQARTRNGLMSSADSVLTQAQVKQRFGEFALRVDSVGSLHLDRAWERRWIVTTRLPQLGTVTCNRAVIGHLRAAMVEITRRGLGATVHTADFHRQGGCWNPRVSRLGAGQLSAHAWGIAVDINVDANPLGEHPHQDPRLVAIMARNGFAWGGRFLRPDGAHFEWVGLPVGLPVGMSSP